MKTTIMISDSMRPWIAKMAFRNFGSRIKRSMRKMRANLAPREAEANVSDARTSTDAGQT